MSKQEKGKISLYFYIIFHDENLSFRASKNHNIIFALLCLFFWFEFVFDLLMCICWGPIWICVQQFHKVCGHQRTTFRSCMSSFTICNQHWPYHLPDMCHLVEYSCIYNLIDRLLHKVKFKLNREQAWQSSVNLIVLYWRNKIQPTELLACERLIQSVTIASKASLRRKKRWRSKGKIGK